MQTENHYIETDLGNISPNPKGDYDDTARYEFLDLVTLQGGSYLCVIPVGQFLTGTAPESGKTTEYWQCLTMPGDMTPQYTDAHDKVVRLAREVAKDAEQVGKDKQSVTQMAKDTAQLKMQAEESARQAEGSKDGAAGYAKGAADAAQRVGQAEENIGVLVNGFDAHVEAKEQEAAQAVQDAKTKAVQAVERQETASIQEVKDQTGAYITEQKEAAKQELDNKVNQFGLDVNAIKKQVSDEGTKQVKAVQDASTAETTKLTQKGTEQAGFVAAEGEKQVQAVQTVAQEIIADREQIKANKTGIAELMQGKANAIVDIKKGSLIQAQDTSNLLPESLIVFGKTEQYTTKGHNLFDASKIKSCTMGTTSVQNMGDGSFVVDGFTTLNKEFFTGYTYSHEDTIRLLKAGNLTLKQELKTLPNCHAKLVAGEQTLLVLGEKEETKEITQDMLDNPQTQLVIAFWGGVGSVVMPGTIKPMLYQDGDGAWEAFSDKKIGPSLEYKQDLRSKKISELVITNKNLLGGRVYYTKYGSGIGFINKFRKNEIPVLPYLTKEETEGIGKIVHCKKGVTYTFSVTNPNENAVIGIAEYRSEEEAEETANKISFTSPRSGRLTYTAKTDGVLLCFISGSWTDGKTTTHTCTNTELLQLEIGKEQTPYAKADNQCIKLQTPIILQGLKVKTGGNYIDDTGQQWLCDQICGQNGIYGIKRYFTIKDITKDTEIFTGLSTFGASDITSVLARYNDNSLQKSGAIVCDCLKTDYNWSTEQESVYMTENSIDFRFKKDRLGIKEGATPEEKKSAVLKFLETNPLHCIAQLKVPEFEPLPEKDQQALETLHTNYPITIAFNDVNADMELSYVADTKLYIKKELEKIVSAQIQNTASLLSLMPLSTQAAMIEADTNNILDNMEVTK